MNLELEKKNIFVTGSSSGIGRAIVKSFLDEGARVCINGRNLYKLKAFYDECAQKYGSDRVLYVCGDATCKDILLEAKILIEKEWGKLDGLVGNLGNGKPIASCKLDLYEWEHMMNINLYSAVRLLDVFFPLMQDNSGIVFVSSLAALDRIGAPPAYAAAKKALLSLVKYMSAIYAERCIRINAIAPGNIFFRGGRWEELINNNENEVKKYINENVPMRRFGLPEEIAYAVSFLISVKSSFTTGVVLNIDGGQRMGY